MRSDHDLELARKRSGLLSVRLTDGVTSYTRSGDSGPWMVLVHGIFTPMLTWERLVPRLVDGGIRVLCYDTFGRGLSDRPAGHYTPELYVRQLRELLDALAIERSILVGWSMGGVTVTRFAAQHPERVGGLGLIAPALLMRRPVGLATVARLKGAGTLVDAFSGALTRVASRSQLSDPQRHAEYLARMHEQRRYRGLGASLASTFGHFAWGAGRELPQHVRDLPTLLVWGKRDPTVPFRRAGAVGALFAQPDWCVLERARHAPHYEHAEVVAPALLSLIQRCAA